MYDKDINSLFKVLQVPVYRAQTVAKFIGDVVSFFGWDDRPSLLQALPLQEQRASCHHRLLHLTEEKENEYSLLLSVPIWMVDIFHLQNHNSPCIKTK